MSITVNRISIILENESDINYIKLIRSMLNSAKINAIENIWYNVIVDDYTREHLNFYWVDDMGIAFHVLAKDILEEESHPVKYTFEEEIEYVGPPNDPKILTLLSDAVSYALENPEQIINSEHAAVNPILFSMVSYIIPMLRTSVASTGKEAI